MENSAREHDWQPGEEHWPSSVVMIVDDDPAVLGTLDRLITSWGHRTRAIGTFEQARRELSTSSPDALVTDVRLGDYNGLQLVHLARQRNPLATLIAISGIDDPVLRVEAANAGAAYLLKPTELILLREHLSGIRREKTAGIRTPASPG
jgi:DNA-binding response OmpR family regulator